MRNGNTARAPAKPLLISTGKAKFSLTTSTGKTRIRPKILISSHGRRERRREPSAGGSLRQLSLHRTDMAAAPPHAGLDHAGGGFGSKLFFCVCEFLHVSDRSHPETATTAEPERRTARAPGPAPEMRAAPPAFLRVARHDHGTALGGFLPRAWDHLVASDGTTWC